jgi:hypothetical protein
LGKTLQGGIIILKTILPNLMHPKHSHLQHRNNRSNNPHLKSFLTVIVVVSFAMIIVVSINYINQKKDSKSATTTTISKSDKSAVETKPAEIPKIKPSKIRLNTLFFGDVFWGRYVDDWAKASPLKYANPFSGLQTFERDKYDAWIAGLECPITSTYLTSKVQDSQLKFSCPTEYTPEAAKWFNAFTLANNHTDNMQEVDGFAQTKLNLENNKIQYFGHYDNAQKSDLCEVVSFKATNVYSDPSSKNNDYSESIVPLAFCGFHNVFKLPKEDELAVISQYSKYFPTIVMPHQGKEYSYKADSLQESYYKKMIDLGGDAVIANHVHSVQNTEAYKGKLIVYSMGNFIFDQQRNAQVTQAIGVNLDFAFENDENYQKILEFSKSCTKFKDNCLETAKKMNLNKPKFKITYDIVGSDNSGKLTKKASDKVFQDLQKKTNWLSTKSFLN